MATKARRSCNTEWEELGKSFERYDTNVRRIRDEARKQERIGKQ